MIADYCDGQVFQQHPLFSRDPCALQIILYYDEVEVVNPLGSKTSKHKVGNETIFFFYCSKSVKPPYPRKQTRYQEAVNGLNTYKGFLLFRNISSHNGL